MLNPKTRGTRSSGNAAKAPRVEKTQLAWEKEPILPSGRPSLACWESGRTVSPAQRGRYFLWPISQGVMFCSYPGRVALCSSGKGAVGLPAQVVELLGAPCPGWWNLRLLHVFWVPAGLGPGTRAGVHIYTAYYLPPPPSLPHHAPEALPQHTCTWTLISGLRPGQPTTQPSALLGMHTGLGADLNPTVCV